MAFQFGRDLTYLGGVAQATATGTSLTSSPVFDLTGFNGALAIQTNVGVTASGNGLLAKGGSASNALSHLAGTWTTAHTSMLMLEVVRPNLRFIQFNMAMSSASGQLGPMLVFGLGPRALPSTNSSLLTYKHVNSPVTGTATSS